MQAQEQINLYIADQPEWQRKLLVRFRQHIHAVDDSIEEVWKGNAPHFEKEGVLVSMHALKTCVSLWFHKGSHLKDTHGLFILSEKDGSRDVRKYKLEEGGAINEKALVDLLKQALKVNMATVKSAPKPTRSSIVLPAELEQVLDNDPEAMAQWEKFSHADKKEYVDWVNDAKQDESRKRRIAKALEMIREGLAKDQAYKVG
jgi:hypothetical protein